MIPASDQTGEPDTDRGPAWRPSEAHWARSRLARLVARAGCDSLDAYRARSAADPAWFWSSMAAELGLPWDVAPREALDLSRGPEFARFFAGAQFNLTTAVIDRWVTAGRGDACALLWESEEGTTGSLTYAGLAGAVAAAAGALASLGVARGSRIAIFMPLIPECAVTMLACARLGAVYTPIFSGFGSAAVASRIADIGATVVVTVDGAWRRGRAVPLKAVVDEAIDAVPDCRVRHVLVVRRLGDRAGDVPWTGGRDAWWDDAHRDSRPVRAAAPTNADDPYMVIYTSGTTGRPKGTRHVHAGFPVKAATDLALCFDVQADDRVLWYSDPGWMMAPWLVQGPLLLGATAVLFDGTPDWPDPGRLWSLVDRHAVTVMGIAPTAIRALMRHGDRWPRSASLASLRALGSSGEPWTPDAWWWYFREVGRGRCPVINYTGGTEIAGGILGCTTIEPQRPCAFTGPVPGMDAAVIDDAGAPVIGAVGELVVRRPWVGMTQSFWAGPGDGPAHGNVQDASPGGTVTDDPIGAQQAADERYLETYWRHPSAPGRWVHGDWARLDPDGSWYILGRSDDTIKVAGKRLGPAEVEAAALAHPGALEAAACGIPDVLKTEAVAVVIVPRDPATLDAAVRPAFEAEVADAIEHALGRALRPATVVAVPYLPKTRSGKVMRRVVRAVLVGDPALGDLSGIDSIDAIDRLREAVGRARQTRLMPTS